MIIRELATAAAELTKQDLWVFPVAANKAPCSAHGLLDATDRFKKAFDLFMAHPHARLIGVAMGAVPMLVGIDVDPRGQQWLWKNWGRLAVAGSAGPTMHRTPRGGVHLVYRMPLPPWPVITSRQVCDGLPLLAHGVDIQGEGRSMIWPPSPGYTVISDAPPAELPRWILHRLLRQPARALEEPRGPPSMQQLERILARVEHSKEGERNNLVFWGGCKAGELVRRGVLSEIDAISLVAARGVQAGLPHVEAWRSARSGVQRRG